MSFFERFVALRYLRSKRKEVFISIITVISVLGVAVSVMVLNIVLAVMTGFETELQAKLIDAGAHIVVRKFGGDIEGHSDLVEKIKKVEGVTAAFPFTYNQAMLTSKAGARGLLIRGVANVPEAREKIEKTLVDKTAFQRLFSPVPIEVERPDGEVNEVILPPLIIGKALRDRLGLLPDTAVTIVSPELSASPQGMVPKLRRFLVVAVYSSGLLEYESGLAYASIEDAQRFFNMGEAVSGIEVSVKELTKAKEVATNIINALGGAESQLYATDWTEPNKPLWDAIKLEKQVYFIVLLLLILVASFSIVSTLVMVVMEKSRDIAILKSLGASNKAVMSIFVLQGAIIGTVGIIFGTILGYLGCLGLREIGWPLDEAVFSLSQVPVHMIPANFATVAGAALIITLSAGIYPAFRAARLNPAEAFRFE